MPKVDPPWRLDPLQMIVRIRWGPVPEDTKGKGPDEPEEEKPNDCHGIIGGGSVETCFTPGIFGVHPSQFPRVIAILTSPSILICPIIPPNEFGDSCCVSGLWFHAFLQVNPGPDGCLSIPKDFQIPPGWTAWIS